MNYRKTGLLLAVIGTLAAFAPGAFAQDSERSYTEGPVILVSNIRTEPGRFDDYMKYLATTYKTLMEEYKKNGIIVDYAVYQAQPTNPDEPDLILTTTYKNMAALDDLATRQDPISKKIWGSLQASNQASAERGKMRTQLGQRMLRKLNLK